MARLSLLLSCGAVLVGSASFAHGQVTKSSVPDVGTRDEWRPGVLENLGLAADVFSVVDGNVPFFVWETAQGPSDLNGNGFDFDHVLHVYSRGTGTVRNLGVTAGIFTRSAREDFEPYGALICFAVEEVRDGDKNGDGDASDHVLHVYDFATDTLWNTGQALFDASTVHSSYYVAGDTVIGFVDESDRPATDHNADGDTTDTVVFFFDPATQTQTNTGLAVTTDQRRVDFGRRWVAFGVDEAAQASQDLNGDGDALDPVLHIHDLQSGATVNVGISAYDMEVGESEILFAVREADEGGVDLNGDGDMTDTVVHLLHLATGTVQNLGLAGHFSARSPGFSEHIDGGTGVFAVSELQQGGVDLNGDGDTFDGVPHRIDLATGSVASLGVAVIATRIEQDLITLFVQESGQLDDLNADGDLQDIVLLVEDVRAPGLFNTALAATGTFLAAERGIAWRVSEKLQFETDFNGDGDFQDDVLFFFDRKKREVVNTRLAADSIFRMDGRWLALMVDEAAQGGTDLNGDGDTADEVTHVFHLIHRTARNLKMERLSGMDGGIVPGHVREEVADLNGDGSLGDRVLHLGRP